MVIELKEKVEKTQNIIQAKVATWLLNELTKIFGEEKISKVEDIQDFMKKEDYSVTFKSQILTLTYELFHKEKLISSYKLDPFSLTEK